MATLFWPEKNLSQSFSYLKNPFNTTNSLIRPVFHGPKVVVLTGSTVVIFTIFAFILNFFNDRAGPHKKIR